MILPIPIEKSGGVYKEIELRRPSGGVMADTLKVITTNNDTYSALVVFLSGVVESIAKDNGLITDLIQIKSLIKNITYKAAEYTALSVMGNMLGVESIEGIYPCPKCKGVVKCEIIRDGNEIIMDTSDKFSELHVITSDEPVIFTYQLDYPYEIEMVGGAKKKIESLKFRLPTLQDCINAFSRYGNKDKARLQYAIYANALLDVNEEGIEQKDRTRYGDVIFKYMDFMDIKNIMSKQREYGLQTDVDKECPDCGTVFKAAVNPKNFFESALRELT